MKEVMLLRFARTPSPSLPPCCQLPCHEQLSSVMTYCFFPSPKATGPSTVELTWLKTVSQNKHFFFLSSLSWEYCHMNRRCLVRTQWEEERRGGEGATLVPPHCGSQLTLYTVEDNSRHRIDKLSHDSQKSGAGCFSPLWF